MPQKTHGLFQGEENAWIVVYDKHLFLLSLPDPSIVMLYEILYGVITLHPFLPIGAAVTVLDGKVISLTRAPAEKHLPLFVETVLTAIEVLPAEGKAVLAPGHLLPCSTHDNCISKYCAI